MGQSNPLVTDHRLWSNMRKFEEKKKNTGGTPKDFFLKKLHKRTLAPCRLYKNKEPGKPGRLKTKSLNLFFQNSVANLSRSRWLFSFNSLFKEKNSALCFWTLQWFFFGVCVRDFFLWLWVEFLSLSQKALWSSLRARSTLARSTT